MIKQNFNIAIIISGMLLLSVACNQRPAEIHYQSDECSYCRMMIMDGRFATQMITSTGKAIKFDSIECLVSYMQEQNADAEGSKLWVNDFDNPGNWLEAGQAYFIESSVIKSPMGGSLLALSSQQEAVTHIEDISGVILRWELVVGHINSQHNNIVGDEH